MPWRGSYDFTLRQIADVLAERYGIAYPIEWKLKRKRGEIVLEVGTRRKKARAWRHRYGFEGDDDE